MKYKCCIMCILLVTFFTQAQSKSDEQAIKKVLDNFHQAAANAHAKNYFSLMTTDFIFLGTDANERWSKTEFTRYAEPHFNKGNGWTYIPQQRNISLINNAKVAFFDELLNNASYGLCRGTGVLVKTENGWKISQYSLSVPLPNSIAKKLVQQIKAFQDKG